MLRGSGRWASQFKNLHKINTKNKPPFFTFSTGTDSADSKKSQPSSAPPPIQVGFTESAGRGVFATRRIGAGELIHTAKPIVSHPSLSSLHSVCYFCLKKLPNKPLFQRDGVSFCSQGCQNQSQDFHEIEKRADWSTFDDYCQTHGLKYPLLVKRFACLVISGFASASSLDILQPASLSPEMIPLMEKEFWLLRSTFQDADITAEQLVFLTKQWYSGVLARIRINAFRVELACGSYEDLLSSAAASVEAEGAVGNAVYILPSFYNHDCDPNAHILWLENVDARIMALRDIDAGEELRICYIDASMDHEARQTILAKGFGFQCNCLRCSSHQ
ncbi:hypothetical protein ACH5RR_002571 [Cinchona calisaya]|uniref:SET domain-containing protein n=1 Tax=Cinchona calisaya TaxID=153742 RepID=A0ABD3ASG4_9GENT